MKILLINYEFPPLGGGAGKATMHIGAELVALGHQVTVLTSRFADLPHEEMWEGLHLKRLHAGRRHADRCSVFSMSMFLANSVRAVAQDAVYKNVDVCCAFFGLPCGPAALALKKLRGVPFVVSLRGGDVPGFQPYDLSMYHAVTRPAITAVWREAYAVVANSISLVELGHRAAPDVPIELIPNGVDQLPEVLAQPSNRPVISFTGRLVEQKGLSFLLDALPAIAEAIPEVRLRLIGDGPLRGRLESQARRLGVAARLEITGWLSRDAVLEHLRDSALFVLPSLDEGMSNALLEAMSAGLPVLATSIPGTEQLVQHGVNGYLAAARDSEALAGRAIELLSETKVRRQMGRASRKIAAGYSWPAVASSYLTIFERAVGQKPEPVGLTSRSVQVWRT